MVENVAIVLASMLIWIPELPRMMHRRNVREIALFALLWAVGLALWLAINQGISTDLVNKFLRGVFEPIGKTLIVPAPQ